MEQSKFVDCGDERPLILLPEASKELHCETSGFSGAVNLVPSINGREYFIHTTSTAHQPKKSTNWLNDEVNERTCEVVERNT